jgi:hypothetical protein
MKTRVAPGDFEEVDENAAAIENAVIACRQKRLDMYKGSKTGQYHAKNAAAAAGSQAALAAAYAAEAVFQFFASEDDREERRLAAIEEERQALLDAEANAARLVEEERVRALEAEFAAELAAQQELERRGELLRAKMKADRKAYQDEFNALSLEHRVDLAHKSLKWDSLGAKGWGDQVENF